MIEHLDPARVKHDTHASPDCLRWQVGAELSPYNPVGAVGANDLAPDATIPASFGAALLLGLVNVSNTLSKVEVGSLLVLDTFKFQQRSVGVLVAKTSLEAKHNSTNIKSAQVHSYNQEKQKC